MVQTIDQETCGSQRRQASSGESRSVFFPGWATGAGLLAQTLSNNKGNENNDVPGLH